MIEDSNMKLTYEELHRQLDYSAFTGLFTWKVDSGNNQINTGLFKQRICFNKN